MAERTVTVRCDNPHHGMDPSIESVPCKECGGLLFGEAGTRDFVLADPAVEAKLDYAEADLRRLRARVRGNLLDERVESAAMAEIRRTRIPFTPTPERPDAR